MNMNFQKIRKNAKNVIKNIMIYTKLKIACIVVRNSQKEINIIAHINV
jgi:hypothetical protein